MGPFRHWSCVSITMTDDTITEKWSVVGKIGETPKDEKWSVVGKIGETPKDGNKSKGGKTSTGGKKNLGRQDVQE